MSLILRKSELKLLGLRFSNERPILISWKIVEFGMIYSNNLEC
ncbi:hypothetical protein AM1_G0166 (plasmid) [Acaryochloris marina MBIC11017]|uniref:Uncharacterized protein n=1 Tax=Acaryochloris marina (strain MBIC 11017) TaxID=329726 RepID=A8ZQR0_ACAM1|nr:hypothetical protein AM1_G0166 [Acaryochloris marina MBIC11017]